MRKLLKLIDFFKSWIYYPEMVRYFKKQGIDISKKWTRIRYAWWHCRVGRLK